MKKSYMNIDNLLSEGFFSKFLNKLSKKLDKMEKISKDRKASSVSWTSLCWYSTYKKPSIETRVQYNVRTSS